MPLIYERRDFRIRLFLDGLEAKLTITSPEGTRSDTSWPRSVIDLASGIPKEVTDAVHESISGTEAALSWPVTMSRVTIELGVREWASRQWETLDVGGRLVVRISPVRPRVLQIPITFPVRVLEVDSVPMVPAAIEATFFNTPRINALIEAHTTLFDAENFPRSQSWPTVEILHVHSLPAGPTLLTNAHDSAPGTSGWFLRFAERFQTRLIVLDGRPLVPMEHRLLAQMIIDRGGPSVLLFGNDASAAQTLYREIAHDRPLDWIHPQIAGSELFCGAGGEEVLRYTALAGELSKPKIASSVKKTYAADMKVGFKRMATKPVINMDAIRSAIADAASEMSILHATDVRFGNLWGTRAERLGDSLAAKLPQYGLIALSLGTRFEELRKKALTISVNDLTDYVVEISYPIEGMSPRRLAGVVTTKVDDIIRSAASYTYDQHESEGMLPLAAKIADVRSLITAFSGPKAQMRGRASRYVNSAFYTTEVDGKLRKIPQTKARLKVDQVVHLGVQIGPKDELTISFGPTRFLEEKVRWDADGASLEIGVTGIDFDVIGDAVQEFYLRREGASDLITFAVRPRESTTVRGVARLRFTIYHRNNIVQSFFVAAVLEDAPSNTSLAMVRALGVSSSAARKIGKAGYIARLEYNTASMNNIAPVSPRGLTILANDSAGDKVTTIKGDDLFKVSKDDNSKIVEGARTTLEGASRRGQAYRYLSFDNTDNAGDPKELVDVLPDIAYAGWRLYNALVPDPGDQDRIRGLLEQGEGIHAAHIDFSNVIPWSMIYDREVFFDKKAAPPSVCPASMPGKDGKMPSMQCGDAGCLLNQKHNDDLRQNGKPVYTEEAVICPRRFWGFMFPIDVPAQKVDGIASSARGLIEEIKVGNPMSVVVGYNDELDFGKKHVTDLETGILKKSNFSSKTGRLSVRALIKENDPDIVYFYCHALAKTLKDGKDLGPTLDFGLGFKGTFDDILLPADFGGKPPWTHAPLVFINGCSALGFNPYAPSEFIKQFIRAKHAAAVVGTETTIVEMLAIEAAKTFFEGMLEGLSAGEAMLRMRCLLLSKHNPLGLMYTLYGSSRLKLVKAAAATVATWANRVY